MKAGGVQAFYDPRTGETTIFPEDIEVGEGETPLRAVARIILHERPARNLLEMISAKPLYLNTKKGRNWLRIAGKQYAGTRGFQSGQANVPNEAVVVNLAESQAPKFASPGRMLAKVLPNQGVRSATWHVGTWPYRLQNQALKTQTLWVPSLGASKIPEFTI